MTPKSRNQLNLLMVLFILLIVIACSCPNVRDDGGGSDRNGSSDGRKDRDAADDSGGSEKPDKGNFVVEYTSVKTPRFEPIDKQIKQEKVLEKAADKLNRSLSLPHDIPLRTLDCGKINAYYDPRDKSITFCYELMEHFYKLFKSAGDSDADANRRMNKAINFVFLHELGHALIDSYELPVTANEEDAADRCSSYICIEELGDEGVESILAAADAFAIESKMRKQPDMGSMADEHLLQEQRFFNSLCMVFGSNPDKYSPLVTKGYLPKARAVRCPSEYERTAGSWEKLLQPWRKD
jgi:hypothetical protein